MTTRNGIIHIQGPHGVVAPATPERRSFLEVQSGRLLLVGGKPEGANIGNHVQLDFGPGSNRVAMSTHSNDANFDVFFQVEDTGGVRLRVESHHQGCYVRLDGFPQLGINEDSAAEYP